jgi:hypothetical protein
MDPHLNGDSRLNPKLTRRVFRSRLFWICVFAACSAAAAIIFPYWRPSYWSLRSQLASTKAKLRDKGEPVSYADLQVADETGNQIGGEVTAISKRFKDTKREFKQVIRVESPLSASDYELLRDALEANREQLDALAAIEAVGQCRFHNDFGVANPGFILLPSVDCVDIAAHLWRADVLLSLHDSRYDDAITAVQELCDTTELLRRERFIVSQLVRVRIGGLAIDSLEEVLAVVDVNDEQLRAIDARLSVMESTCRLADALRAERAVLFTTLENIGHPDVRESLGMMAGLGPGSSVQIFAPSRSANNKWASLSYAPEMMRQEVWLLNQMSAAANLVDIPGTEAGKQWNEVNREISETVKCDENSPLFHLFPAIDYLRDRALAYRQRLLAARLALRVIRYRTNNQALPSDLTAVQDEQLPMVPPGLWNEAEPSFDLRPDGFAIFYPTTGVDDELDTSVSVSFPPDGVAPLGGAQ